MIAAMPNEQKEAFVIDEQEAITFPSGLLGFESLSRFVVLGDNETYPCQCLQSLDDPWVGFTVIDPSLFFVDYCFTIPEADRAELGLRDGEAFYTLAIVVVPEDPLDMTANLLAPVIINPRTRLGKQVILQGCRYSVRQRVIDRQDAA